MNLATYFFENGRKIADAEGILPLPLFKGMQVTVHSYEGIVFTVVDWDYHHGHPDENAGLRIHLQRKVDTTAPAANADPSKFGIPR